jgi:hypothetical protein
VLEGLSCPLVDGVRIDHVLKGLSSLPTIKEHATFRPILNTHHDNTNRESLEDAENKVEVLPFLSTRGSLEDRKFELLG